MQPIDTSIRGLIKAFAGNWIVKVIVHDAKSLPALLWMIAALVVFLLYGCTDDLPRKEAQDMPPDLSACAEGEFGSRCLDAGLMVSCGWQTEYFDCAPCVEHGEGSLSCGTPRDMGGL